MYFYVDALNRSSSECRWHVFNESDKYDIIPSDYYVQSQQSAEAQTANDIMTQRFFFFVSFWLHRKIPSTDETKRKRNCFCSHMLLYASASAHAKEDNDNHVFHFSVLLMGSKPHNASDTKTKTAIQAFGPSFVII